MTPRAPSPDIQYAHRGCWVRLAAGNLSAIIRREPRIHGDVRGLIARRSWGLGAHQVRDHTELVGCVLSETLQFVGDGRPGQRPRFTMRTTQRLTAAN